MNTYICDECGRQFKSSDVTAYPLCEICKDAAGNEDEDETPTPIAPSTELGGEDIDSSISDSTGFGGSDDDFSGGGGVSGGGGSEASY